MPNGCRHSFRDELTTKGQRHSFRDELTSRQRRRRLLSFVFESVMGSCLFISWMKGASAQQTLKLNDGVRKVKLYSYKELKAATGDFSLSNRVGGGGFGSVYKGTLKNGTVVAVKVLSSESTQGAKEFLTEITSISDIVHENLVKLYGCCMEGNHRILVYNYLDNNSLAQTLLGAKRNDIRFSWRRRRKICIGVARGLAFLHEEIRPHILHRDIKASNILLDKNLIPKISDFGLARLLPSNATHISTRVAGTLIITNIEALFLNTEDTWHLNMPYAGRISSSEFGENGLQYPDVVDGILILQTWAHYEHGELERIIDSSLTNDLDIKEACRFLKIGLLCTQDASKLRPSMSTVVKMLKSERDVQSEKITHPGLVTDFTKMKI
ncbi:putative LRR receptor-like serine/threonine-protein kinase [Apostasia shenzhenica]|uniref:non-specific serine/threonine protein kinase n=1 Tax=Apostasia shenzhenica TaxID=1088818 RepID=A0A2I0A9Q8_9ASPA|nr:putative LRR receptor-like serine/threonine-protein kinase [Apostasia shenzhenica]